MSDRLRSFESPVDCISCDKKLAFSFLSANRVGFSKSRFIAILVYNSKNNVLIKYFFYSIFFY